MDLSEDYREDPELKQLVNRINQKLASESRLAPTDVTVNVGLDGELTIYFARKPGRGTRKIVSDIIRQARRELGLAPGSQPAVTEAIGSDAAEQPASPRLTVSLNKGSSFEFRMLPGVDPALAQAIVDYRSKCGLFWSIDDLARVPGVDDDLLAEIRPNLKLD